MACEESEYFLRKRILHHPVFLAEQSNAHRILPSADDNRRVNRIRNIKLACQIRLPLVSIRSARRDVPELRT